MTETRTERGSCRFIAEKGDDGKPVIRLQLFHGTVSILGEATMAFNLLGGLSLEQARKIADGLNENVLDLSVCLKGSHPMFNSERVSSLK